MHVRTTVCNVVVFQCTNKTMNMYSNNTTAGVCYSLYCAVASTKLALEISSTEVSALTASLLVHECH